MHVHQPTLHILCGKIAAGKSTLAARLGSKPETLFIAEDTWLGALFSNELRSVEDYVRCSSKLKGIMGPHVEALLASGMSVVLDFPANTPSQRSWFKGILATTGVPHTLHFLDVSDEVCLARLHARNAAGTHPFAVTDAQFHEVTSYFAAPTTDEGFNIVYVGDGSEDKTESPLP